MSTLSLTVDAQALATAFAKAPAALSRNLDSAMGRILREISREARRNAPKAFSTLTQSIKDQQLSAYEGEVVAGVDYARAVEEGTGIYGSTGRPENAAPPVDNILDWIRVRNIVPNDPSMDEVDLAFVMARSIARTGTPAQPFMVPALDAKRADATQRINAAIDKTLISMGS